MSHSLQPRGLYPATLLCPWNFPGKNTGVSCNFLLQRIFPTHGSNLHLLCLLHCGFFTTSTTWEALHWTPPVVIHGQRSFYLQMTDKQVYPSKPTALAPDGDFLHPSLAGRQSQSQDIRLSSGHKLSEQGVHTKLCVVDGTKCKLRL